MTSRPLAGPWLCAALANARSAAPARRARRCAFAVLALALASSATAGAGPLADALARHGSAEVAALRARRDDPAARCTLGAVFARRGDLPRAALYLTGCAHAELPADIAAAVREAVRDVKRRLDASRYAALDVVSRPDGLTAEIDALPGETFTTPATVWVAPGVHVVRAFRGERSWDRRVTAEPRKNGVVVIETGLDARPPPPPRPQAIDFAVDDPGGELGEHHAAPPADIKHPPLTPDRYRGIPGPAAEGPIDDPLAPRAAPAGWRNIWLGLRLGAGMFDDGAAAARPGLALGLAGRYRLTDILFAAGRADWSRRGGDAMTSSARDGEAVDVLGASAGIGATIAGRGAPADAGLPIAVIAQLRADLRLADARGAAPVRRAGLGVAACLELALPSTPFTVGVRLEQGLTELVPGARDRAILAELGVDLR
jgi:hypothetical protein